MSDARRLVGPYQPDVDELEPEAWVDVAEYAALGHQLDGVIVSRERAFQQLRAIAALCDEAEADDGPNLIPVRELRAILAGTPEPDPWTDPDAVTTPPDVDPWTSPIPLIDQPEGSTP